MALRKFIDDDVRRVTEKEIIDEMILPSMSQQWHVYLVRLGTKSSSLVKEIAIALENFEDYERNFDANPNTNKRRNNKDNNRNENWKIRTKVKTCAEPLDVTTNGKIAT